MPRPRNKNELIKAMNDEFIKLCKLLENTPNEILKSDFEAPLPTNTRDKNARDVLIHLYEWQQMLQNFIKNNLTFNDSKFITKNEISPFLPSPYNWKTYPKLNVELWQKHQKTSFETALNLLKESHQSIFNVVQNLSDEELFEKRYFNFTGSTNLGSYIISSTSSHYIWAIKQLKSGLNR